MTLLTSRYRPEPTTPLSVQVRREGLGLPNRLVRPMVGLLGKKRAGKDTFAQGLVELGYERFAFADPLKAAALAINPLIGAGIRLADSVESLGWEDAKEIPEVRRFLQDFGIGIRALDEDFWARRLDDAAFAAEGPLVVTDVRFPNEVERVRSWGGYLVRIVRPDQDDSDTHASENALNDFEVDHVVVNAHGIDDLVATARSLVTSFSF